MKYGPENPHPLSRMKTELVWEGKYDEYGNRREVNAADLAMPLQRIETLDEPRSRAEEQGSLFDAAKAHRDDFRSRLIWGENKLVMASLLEEFRGKIDLIYIDPPFDVGADFTMSVPIGDQKDEIEKDQSILEMVAYRDMWGRQTNSYLTMIHERLTLMKELLSERGTIYVHVDSRMNSAIKLLMDEIFGKTLLNEIIWHYRRWPTPAREWQKMHDTILAYCKVKGQHIFQKQYGPRSEETQKRWKDKSIVASHSGGGRRVPSQSTEAVSEGAPLDDVWDISIIAPVAHERLDYPTQKPEALVRRILESSSEEGSLVADFFCGSGTTLAVAEKMNRKWIGCDLGRFSVHTARKRLIGVQRELHDAGKPYRSFDVYNLGRYERQWWQKEALKGADEEHRAIVLKFFKAEPLAKAPSPLIHARKGTAFVHVDGIDSIFTRAELVELARATAAAGGREVYALAWDFEMDIRQVAAAVEAETGVKLRLSRIPREIMEKNRTQMPPFFEVALLEAEPVIRKNGKGKIIDIKLKNFLPSLSEVPGKELEALQERAMTSGFDFIDFWAIDFDWAPNRPFNHHWQDFRTRRDRSLKTVSDTQHAYTRPGTYTACVKVVDVFGCDTSITVEVKV